MGFCEGNIMQGTRFLGQQPLRAEEGVEVRGGFLPWHFD